MGTAAACNVLLLIMSTLHHLPYSYSLLGQLTQDSAFLMQILHETMQPSAQVHALDKHLM